MTFNGMSSGTAGTPIGNFFANLAAALGAGSSFTPTGSL